MKKAWFIIVSGLFLAVAAYACAYLAGASDHPSAADSGGEALLWLKREYHLSDAQFARVRQLHEKYQPRCREMCRRIDEKNAELQELLAVGSSVTPEVRKKLSEAALLRVECQAAMLAHFYEVARVMPAQEGKRYLAWMQQETLLPGQMPPTKPPFARSATNP